MLLGALEPNPAYEPPSTYSADVWKDIAMWAVLLFGVLLLLYLTFRSAPKEPDAVEADEVADQEPAEAGDEAGGEGPDDEDAR